MYYTVQRNETFSVPQYPLGDSCRVFHPKHEFASTCVCYKTHVFQKLRVMEQFCLRIRVQGEGLYGSHPADIADKKSGWTVLLYTKRDIMSATLFFIF